MGVAAVLYLALLLASHIVRLAQPEESRPLSDSERFIELPAIDGLDRTSDSVRLVYTDSGPTGPAGNSAVLLIHGSPGRKENFFALRPPISQRYRVIVPDLPGFGASSRDIPDYSLRAHAGYLLQLLDELGLESVHLVGFSMGGGVSIRMIEAAPERVRSLSLVSAIGVQELELLGNYQMNHLVHGAQVAGLWLLREAFPHFGWLDKSFFSLAYARNFYDSDQRPLRATLEEYRGPAFIFHGRNDPLAPVEAAREHLRILPQSEPLLTDDSHFAVFRRGPFISRRLIDFLDRVEAGQALTRDTAPSSRVAEARLPFDPRSIPTAAGLTLLVMMTLIAVSTLVSEDLACIGTGFAVAAGRIDFVWGAVACFIGIYLGDLALFWVGRLLGRPALQKAPLKWLIRTDEIERSSRWLRRRGPAVIALSRFLPGTRLPTYVAAGALKTRFWTFALYFFLPAAIWTPALVALAAYLGRDSVQALLSLQKYAWLGLLGLVALILLMTRLVLPSLTAAGRRRLVGRWRRIRNWEFWPPWFFYPPLVLYVLWLGVRHRSLSLFTAANPAFPEGGFIGESKSAILDLLESSGGPIAAFRLLPASLSAEAALKEVRAFLGQKDFDYPVVLKPDRGERGRGVRVARDDRNVLDYFSRPRDETIVQEYVGGEEFGIFYTRYPDRESGKIFSITRKILPHVEGDGLKTIEALILADPRAVSMASLYFSNLTSRLDEVPPPGEKIRLTSLGTHCRGAIFEDGSRPDGDLLLALFDGISQRLDGFYFGRYDLKAPSEDDMRQGKNIRILELNGVTSEATHIYDRRYGVLYAYRTLAQQWRIAFRIGDLNRKRGVSPSGIARLIRVLAVSVLKRSPRRAGPQPEDL